MTDTRDRGPQNPRDRPDAPPDPESGAPVPVPAAVPPHAAHAADADIEAALARGDDIHEAMPAEPERPGAGALALSLVLPGVGQIVMGRLAVGGALLLAWGVLLGVAALGYDSIRTLTDTGSLDDYVAIATIGILALGVWVFAFWDLRRQRDQAHLRGDSQWRIAARHFRRNRVAVIGLAIVVVFYLIALLAPLLAPYDPIAQHDIARTSYLAPSAEHWLGTDLFGRDVLSRILYGARISLAIGFVATAISITLGTLIGAVAGYVGGKVDAVLMRITDMVLAFPRLVLLIMIVALFSPSITVIITVLGLTQWPSTTRIVRGDVLSLREREFVQAARALGYRGTRIVLRHLIPNVLAPVIVAATLGIGNTIVLEAGLSFLGLGVAAPTPTWGNMVADGRSNLLGAWWLTTFPGLTIVFVVLAFNLVGDGLRDALDPRLRI